MKFTRINLSTYLLVLVTNLYTFKTAGNTGEIPFEFTEEQMLMLVQGVDIEIEEAPWNVAIELTPKDLASLSSGACGTLIGKQWILTAAHNVYFPEVYPEKEGILPTKDIKVVAGKSDFIYKQGDKTLSIRKVYVNPNFNITTSGDACLLKVGKDEIKHLNKKNIRPIRYAKESFWRDVNNKEERLKLSIYGFTSPSLPYRHRRLNRLTFMAQYESNQEANDNGFSFFMRGDASNLVFVDAGTTSFWWFTLSGHALMPGDSGGGVIVDSKSPILYGVGVESTFGVSMDDPRPCIHTNLGCERVDYNTTVKSAYLSAWIKQITGISGFSPSDLENKNIPEPELLEAEVLSSGKVKVKWEDVPHNNNNNNNNNNNKLLNVFNVQDLEYTLFIDGLDYKIGYGVEEYVYNYDPDNHPYGPSEVSLYATDRSNGERSVRVSDDFEFPIPHQPSEFRAETLDDQIKFTWRDVENHTSSINVDHLTYVLEIGDEEFLIEAGQEKFIYSLKPQLYYSGSRTASLYVADDDWVTSMPQEISFNLSAKESSANALIEKFVAGIGTVLVGTIIPIIQYREAMTSQLQPRISTEPSTPAERETLIVVKEKCD